MKVLFTVTLCILSLSHVQGGGVYGAVSQHKACGGGGSHETAADATAVLDQTTGTSGTTTSSDGKSTDSLSNGTNGGSSGSTNDAATAGGSGSTNDATAVGDGTSKGTTSGPDNAAGNQAGGSDGEVTADTDSIKTNHDNTGNLVGTDGSNVATASNGDEKDEGFSLSIAAIAVIAMVGAICILVGVIIVRKRQSSTYDPSKEFDEEEYVITRNTLAASEAPTYSHSIAIHSEVSSEASSAIYDMSEFTTSEVYEPSVSEFSTSEAAPSDVYTTSEVYTAGSTSEVFSIDDDSSEFSYSDASDFMSEDNIGYHL